MKLKLAILLFLLAAPLSLSAQKNKLIGYKHKGVIYGETLPNGAKDLGGGLLADENYGVTRFSKGKNFMLWLERITARDNSGVPNWEVKDVLTFDRLKKNQQFLLSYSSECVRNGKPDLNLIVLAETIRKSKNYKIVRAWKVNTRRERFENASIRQIKCTVAAS